MEGDVIDVSQMGDMRSYQVELSRMGIKGENVLIFAPTGTGKTMVAVKIVEEHLRVIPDAKVVFLVPVVALVDQQCKAFQSSMTKKTKISSMSSASKSLNTPLSWNIPLASVFVITSDILKNALEETNENKLESINTFSLIIFDECHHCDKKHSYNKIMSYYFKEKRDGKKVPQIIGLTASTGTNQANSKEEALSQLFTLCGNLDVYHISTVEQYKEDLESIQSKPSEEIFEPVAREVEHFDIDIQQEMAYCEKLLHNMKDEDRFQKSDQIKTLVTFPADRLHPKYLQQVKMLKTEVLKNSLGDSSDILSLMSICRYLKVSYKALMVNHLFRSADAISLIEKKVEQLQSGSTVSKTEINLRSRMQCLIKNRTKYDHPENPSLECLKEKIQSQIESIENSRILVFVRERVYAEILRNIFSSNMPSVRSNIVLGSEGLTKNLAQEILNQFKRGDVNVLFATSVVEEGSDVPDCNMVIKYGHVTNETARVQTRGRARAIDSKYVIIVPPQLRWQVDKENINTKRESLMYEAIEEFQKMEPDLVREKIRINQEERELLDTEESFSSSCVIDNPTDSATWDMHCRNCKQFICTSADLRLAEKAHYVIVNEERFSSMKVLDTNQNNAAIRCSNCQQQLASRQKYKAFILPNVKVEKFIFRKKDRSSFDVFTQWKKVPFTVADCKVSDLKNINRNHCLST